MRHSSLVTLALGALFVVSPPSVATLAALFAEEGFVLQSGRAPVRGRAAIRASYAGQGGGPLRLRALAYAASDTAGYIIGAYGYGDVPGDAHSAMTGARTRRVPSMSRDVRLAHRSTRDA